jgi:hypothetical protein
VGVGGSDVGSEGGRLRIRRLVLFLICFMLFCVLLFLILFYMCFVLFIIYVLVLCFIF